MGAGMEPIVEFNEEDLYHDEDRAEDRPDVSDEDIEIEDDEDTTLRAEDGLDDAGASSAKSSLIQASFGGADGDSLPHDAAEASGEHMSGRAIAASMPASTGHVRMGSSVPVSIPHMGRWKKSDAAPDSPTTQYAAATFIPPHQLSGMPVDFMFSFTGDSPSVAVKRERLRARNAILKSTGFLEPGVVPVTTIGLQEQRNRLNVPVTAGGLSQALQQQGSVVAAAAFPAAIESS